MGFLEKMQKRWGVGAWAAVLILLAFALTGLTVVRIRQPIMALILPADAPAWVSWAVYLLVIFPLYQVLLLTYGALLGQFNFFWPKFKAVGRFMARRPGPTMKSEVQNDRSGT